MLKETTEHPGSNNGKVLKRIGRAAETVRPEWMMPALQPKLQRLKLSPFNKMFKTIVQWVLGRRLKMTMLKRIHIWMWNPTKTEDYGSEIRSR